VWVDMLGPMLSSMEHFGYSDMAILGPTATALHRQSVIGLYFSADWCQPCLVFTLVLEKLYAAQRARGANQLEVVLVSQCREAKATNYYREIMPWLSMWHNADNEVGMEARTSTLMAKYGITSIPALVLLDKCRGLICADARDKCVEDPEGRAFLWQQQSRFP
jgi:nucleoredoxin